MSSEQNKQIVRRFVMEGLNAHDFNRVADLLDPHYTNYILGGAGADLAGTQQAMAQFVAAFPDLTVTIEEIVAEGDWVATRGTVTGTHQGEFNGIPATGRQVRVQENTFFRLRDGKILEDRPLMDMLSMLQQLGVVPASGEGR